MGALLKESRSKKIQCNTDDYVWLDVATSVLCNFLLRNYGIDQSPNYDSARTMTLRTLFHIFFCYPKRKIRIIGCRIIVYSIHIGRKKFRVHRGRWATELK